MASINRTCFIFDKDESTKILIQMIYEIPSTQTRRKFNLLRSIDESVSQTIRRLIANIERADKKETKSFKRRSKQQVEEIPQETILVQLLDENNQLIDENQTNKQAWTICRELLINKQVYHVEYNAPGKTKALIYLIINHLIFF
jgi:negative regulator of replication initiation